MLRSRSNWMVIAVVPSALVEVICATRGICATWVSSGCATAEAMVSGLAPGRFAETWIVGKSTCGSGATGTLGETTMPTNQTATLQHDVATGWRGVAAR